LAGALTPKAIVWNVMQITKIHFLQLQRHTVDFDQNSN